MTNSKRLIFGWLLATAIALTLSWSAVAQVRNRVIEPAVAIPTTSTAVTVDTPSEPQVIRLDGDDAPSQTVLETPPATTTPITAPPLTTAAPPPVSEPGTAPTTTSPPATTTTVPDPATATTTSTTATTATTTTTTTTTTAPQEATTASYTLVGGVVTISSTTGTVNFVAAVPQPGFSTETRETGPDEVRIRFESENHTSDFRAEWEDEELRITVSETGEDDG